MFDKVAHPKKLMIQGAINKGFKSDLIFIEVTINGDKYFEEIICSGFLEKADEVYGFNNWIFQQDNARPHVKKDVVEAMENLSIKLLPWPPYSSDLNIIETVWAIMKRRVEKEKPTDLAELKMIITEVWNNLSFETIQGLINEMPRRLDEVIRTGGYTIQRL